MPKEIQLPESLDAEQAADVLRAYAKLDEPEMVESETLSALKNEITEAKEAFAAVIAEQSPQSAETLARQDMDALTEPFRDDEGSIDVDTLRQEPVTQDGPSGDSDGDDPSTDWDGQSMTLDQNDTLQQLSRKRTSFQNRGIESRVDALEAEMVEVAGAPDFETLEREVL